MKRSIKFTKESMKRTSLTFKSKKGKIVITPKDGMRVDINLPLEELRSFAIGEPITMECKGPIVTVHL